MAKLDKNQIGLKQNLSDWDKINDDINYVINKVIFS